MISCLRKPHFVQAVHRVTHQVNLLSAIASTNEFILSWGTVIVSMRRSRQWGISDADQVFDWGREVLRKLHVSTVYMFYRLVLIFWMTTVSRSLFYSRIRSRTGTILTVNYSSRLGIVAIISYWGHVTSWRDHHSIDWGLLLCLSSMLRRISLLFDVSPWLLLRCRMHWSFVLS